VSEADRVGVKLSSRAIAGREARVAMAERPCRSKERAPDA
jgi:hypothetical protein